MFCINLDDKKRHLHKNILELKRVSKGELSDTFRDLDILVKNISSLRDFLIVEDQINYYNKVFGYEEVINWEEDICNEIFPKKIETHKKVTFADKKITFENSEIKTIGEVNLFNSNMYFYKCLKKPKKEYIEKPDESITLETKRIFIDLLKVISKNILDMVNREDWNLEIERYEKMDLNELSQRFRYNNIYELNIFLEKYDEFKDLKIMENRYVEEMLRELETYNDKVYNYIFQIENKINELLDTILLKYRIIEILKEIYLNGRNIENQKIRSEIMFIEYKKMYDLIICSNLDYYYINLLLKLLEFK